MSGGAPPRSHRLILAVSAAADRLEGYRRTIGALGYHTLAAPSPARALALLEKVRPSAIIVDAALADGAALALLGAVRARRPLQRVAVIVAGYLTAEERERVADDPCVAAWPGPLDASGEEGVSVSALIDRAIQAARASVAEDAPPEEGTARELG